MSKDTLGVMLIVIAILILPFAKDLFDAVERAQFERRNSYGVEIFKDYDESKKIRAKEALMESCAKLIVVLAVIISFTGLCMF